MPRNNPALIKLGIGYCSPDNPYSIGIRYEPLILQGAWNVIRSNTEEFTEKFITRNWDNHYYAL